MNKFLQNNNLEVPTVIRRGLVDDCVNIEGLANAYKNNKNIVLTFQRLPSTESITFAHLCQLLLMKQLQSILDCTVVVSILDDTFYYESGFDWNRNNKFVEALKKDIEAVGFNKDKLIIAVATEQIYKSYGCNVQVARSITHNAVIEELQTSGSDSVGSIYNNAHPIALMCAKSFDLPIDSHFVVFTSSDRKPQSKLAEIAFEALGWDCPTFLFMKQLPALSGHSSPLTARVGPGLPTLFVRGINIKNVINKKALSGGQQTVEQQRELGGNIDVDIAYAYLVYFLENDDELKLIAASYASGELLTGELKSRCIEVLTELSNSHIERFNAL